MTQPARAVIFDLDGTLIDSARPIAGILHLMQEARGLPKADIALVRQWVSRGADSFIPPAMGYAFSDETRRHADVAEFRRIYRATPPDPGQIYPHVLPMLKSLKQQGYRLGICTNKPEATAQLIIDGIGLAPFIDAVVGKRDGQPEKPDPAPLLQTLKEVGATPANAVYIGDSEVDAATARATGMPFYLVRFGYAIGRVEDIDCVACIDDFRHLLPLLINSNV